MFWRNSIGALDILPHIEVRTTKAMEELHFLSFQTIGLDSEGPKPRRTFKGDKIALILGTKAKGCVKTREQPQTLRGLICLGYKIAECFKRCGLVLYAAHQYLSSDLSLL